MIGVARVTIVALLVSCTSSDPAQTSADTAPASCTLIEGSCVASSGTCCQQLGALYDESRNCRAATRATIGCAPNPIPKDSACIDLGIVGCAITNEGGVRRVWSTASRAVGWEPAEKCSDELTMKVFNAAPCADDAGP